MNVLPLYLDSPELKKYTVTCSVSNVLIATNLKLVLIVVYLEKRNIEVERNVVNGRYFVVSRSTSE